MADQRKSFDYIIIGGGTAGLVLANRLSEDASTTVAVIEAGGDPSTDPRVIVPGFVATALGSELDWGFGTVPQKQMNNNRLGAAAGKMLGGTSSINFTALLPPSASDIDAWEKLGNDDWNWKTLSPYLEKVFSLTLPDEATAEHLHLTWPHEFAKGGKGPVKASFPASREDPMPRALVETVEQLGFPLTASPFSGHSTGAFGGILTIDPATRTRSSSLTAYYQPVASRTNLEVFTDSMVEKIVIENNGEDEPVATGVKFSRGGMSHVLHATKEVILSAGAFNSPKVLELSGIGDPKILHAAGIDVKLANPFVGTNLQDHIVCGISFEAVDGLSTMDNMMRKDPEVLGKAMEMYQQHKTGPFSTTGVTSFAYLPTADFKEDTNALNFMLDQLKFSSVGNHPLHTARTENLAKILTNADEGTGQYMLFPAHSQYDGDTIIGPEGFGGKPPLEGNYVSVLVGLSHPLSTGTCHITSSDSKEPPEIDHQYYSNELDLELQARHVRYLQKIATTGPFGALFKPEGRRNHPDAFIGDDLEKAKKFVRESSTSNWHSVGTCAMAPKEKGGVVDSKMRVYGVKGLRVVDASIFPLVPQSNTQSLVYMVAERAGDIIRGKA
ncbi:GMC oxidoreductase [Amniculicola lignicola CBS 123094]|uniref:GMC oxidoreductase n=1 Tax=Amniculicola lignicola CBS 123094 TaxID=1392246 RepID=A0A6A5WJY5_9PLEO|nr:GMC oxidoreductase [Amniculicola lignicola CBS 123094]